MPEDAVFYGDGRVGENAQDFMKGLKRVFLRRATPYTDDQKIENFELSVASGSQAEAWLKDLRARLGAQNPVVALTWALLETNFDTRWPARVAVKRSGPEAVKDLMAEAGKLKVDDVGKKIQDGGVEQWGHIVWARKMREIAETIPDPSGLFIDQVRTKLPILMQELLDPGSTIANWADFQVACTNLSISKIDFLKEKQQATPVPKPSPRTWTPMANNAQRFVIPRQPNYPAFAFGAPPPPAGQQNVANRPLGQPGPRILRPAPERLADMLRNLPQHHEDTEDGRRAYDAQVRDWQTRNPRGSPNEYYPYPLRPGSAPLEARGACFNCGGLGHLSANCPNASMPQLENQWRKIANSIRRDAMAGGPARGPPQPTPAPMHYVGQPYAGDYAGQPQYVSDQLGGHYEYVPVWYADHVEEQGKAEGPSA
ncbi:hypothetical protein C8F01DRAFT_1362279 [Mycena amicta]|nr:hypothetical protein C8F01DRAFT_1362279 [Mycena amicta]